MSNDTPAADAISKARLNDIEFLFNDDNEVVVNGHWIKRGHKREEGLEQALTEAQAENERLKDTYSELQGLTRCDVCENFTYNTAQDNDGVQCIPCTKLEAAVAENRRLKYEIKAAPHSETCDLIGYNNRNGIACADKCWKVQALKVNTDGN